MDNNFFSVRFVSWSSVEKASGILLAWGTMMMLWLMFCWWLVGMPKAPPGLPSCVVGVILLFFGLLLHMAWAQMLPTATKLKACHFGMPRDYAVLTQVGWGLIVFGLIFLLT